MADGQTNADLTRTVTFSCASDKVKLYEPIYAADGTTQAVDANNVPLYKEFTGSGLTVADLPKTIYLLPVKDSASKRDIELKLSYACPQNEATHEDVVKLTNLLLDLDTDSNGNGTVEVDSYEEDSTEENASIVVNEGDKDGDGIPDNVDFYISGNGFNTPIFKEIKLRLPHSIKLDNCKIKLKYGAGTPPATENGTTYIASGSQSLRIWKKQSNESRTFSDFIPPTVENDPDSYYTPASLLGGGYEGMFYVESLCPADNYKADITVTIVPIEIRNGIVDPLPTEDTIPETYNLSDKVGFSTLNIDLDIDSDNNAWTSWSPDDTEDSVEDSTDQPGKIMFTNEGCESNAQRPDYANLAERSGETNLVPMRLSMNTSLPLSNFKIKFEYQGESQLPDFASAPMAITGDAIKNIPFTSGKTYKDYTVLKKGILRVWAGVASHTAARKANKFGTKSDSSLTDPDGNYLAPTSGVDDAYPAELLFNGQSGPNYSINLWVEGINPSDATRVKATLLHQPSQGGTWNETIADAVKIKVVEGNLAVNVNNDPEFELDENDDKLEDQNDGFNCWSATQMPNGATIDSDTSRSCSHGLENLFPVKTKLDSSITSLFKYYIKIAPIGHTGTGAICENVNYADNRMGYLKDSSSGISQITETTNMTSSLLIGESMGSTYILLREDEEFLFGLNSTGEYKITLLAELQLPSGTKPQITVDTCKVTGRSIDEFFWFGSCRGNKNMAYTYPTDKTRYFDMASYPEVSHYTGFGEREIVRDDYLIFIHGYNVNIDQAITWNQVVFRRLFWNGYRGNYIGITWNGDEYQVGDGQTIPTLFDPNVLNAMESSPSIKKFIKNTVQNSWGIPASKINIVAHSLGNLVMWDSLRLFKHQYSEKAAATAISIEAAVWKETFWSENNFPFNWEIFTYDDDNNLTNTTTGNTTYSIDDLTKNSWSFWFNQKTVGGNSLIAKDAVSSSVNSYLSDDEALAYMITNENLFRPYRQI